MVMTLKTFPIIQLLLLFFADLALCYSNSFYDPKRLSRSTRRPSYDPYDYYSRSQRYPYGYYPSYAQMYPDEYYYDQDSYPLYYVSPRALKYDLYQTGLPYYYQDLPVARGKYNYYNYADPSPEDQERLFQEFEREQRERSQPIGHEIRYENDYNTDDDDDGDDVDITNNGGVDETNAAIFSSLVRQQLLKDAAKYKNPQNYYEQYPSYADYAPSEEADTFNIPKWDDLPYDRPVNVDDEDVKELKELPKKQKQRKNRQRKQQQRKQQKIENIANDSPSKRSQTDNVIVYTDRKPVVKQDLAPEGPRREVRGQKEEVLMRPATPVRHPFSDSVLDMLSQQGERKRSPSVYDTIRHMLEMEKKYEENQPETKPELRPSMQKRIVSSEDSLTKQLSVLKKAQ